MSYTRTAEDTIMHAKHHKRVVGGIDYCQSAKSEVVLQTDVVLPRIPPQGKRKAVPETQGRICVLSTDAAASQQSKVRLSVFS